MVKDSELAEHIRAATQELQQKQDAAARRYDIRRARYIQQADKNIRALLNAFNRAEMIFEQWGVIFEDYNSNIPHRRLQAHCLSKGMSVHQLALCMNMNHESVGRIIDGLTPINANTAHRIAYAFDGSFFRAKNWLDVQTQYDITQVNIDVFHELTPLLPDVSDGWNAINAWHSSDAPYKRLQAICTTFNIPLRQLVRATKIPRTLLQRIYNGERRITADDAYRLAFCLEHNPQCFPKWLNMQRDHDMRTVRVDASKLNHWAMISPTPKPHRWRK